jgi:hypothetical protein
MTKVIGIDKILSSGEGKRLGLTDTIDIERAVSPEGRQKEVNGYTRRGGGRGFETAGYPERLRESFKLVRKGVHRRGRQRAETGKSQINPFADVCQKTDVFVFRYPGVSTGRRSPPW